MSDSAGAKPRISPRLAAIKAAKKAEMKKPKLGNVSALICDPLDAATQAKDVVKGKTGLICGHPDMLAHANPWDPRHIEKPNRLARAVERIRELKLDAECVEMDAVKAEEQDVLLVHSQAHLDKITQLIKLDEEERRRECLGKFHSVFANPKSLDAALLACGSAVKMTEAVIRGEVQNGMALVRPPGHHAMKEEACGFCLFNNVGVAAKKAIKDHGLQRVLIVDFDVHHGQATQQLFSDDPNVLYVSIHRYEYGSFWPHLRESDYDFIGEKEGKGFNVNVPLNRTGARDADYLSIFHQVILPMAYEFNPELVLVSAGYDAAIGCPEGHMDLTPMVYGHIINALMSLAQGKVVVVMEGGYFVESLAEGVAMTLRALLGHTALTLGSLQRPSEAVVDTILNVISAHRAQWSSICVQDEYDISKYDANVDKNCHEPTLCYEGPKAHGDVTVLEPPRDLNEVEYTAGDHYLDHSEEATEFFKQRINKIRFAFQSQLEFTYEARTGLVYDKEMAKHANTADPNHPERPERVLRIIERLEEFGIPERKDVVRVSSRPVTKEEVVMVHEEKHFDEMSTLPNKEQTELNEMADKLDSIYFNPETFSSASLACGSLLNVVDKVCEGQTRNGLAVIRPPGHHAESDEACGFCIFNNVAVAAEHAIRKFDLDRVLILDWDVHHGNGIQNMFYDNPKVLYISLHRFDGGTFFPTRPDANFDFVGENRGEGYNINIPWNGSGMGDPEYLAAFFNIVLPVCYQFNPELVLVSSGFDAAVGDPLGHCKVTPEMYGHMVHHLQNLAGGKVVVALEGGYNLNSISYAATMCAKALLGDPMPPVLPPNGFKPKDSAIQSIRNVIRTHSKYWSCLCFDLRLPDSFEDLKTQLFSTPKKKSPFLSSPLKPAVSHSPYIPTEFGRYADCTVINTISSSAIKSQKGDVVDSKTIKENKSKEDLEKAMENMTLASNLKKNNDDYVPSEYGRSFGSPFVNTISSSSGRAEVKMTDSKKDAKE